MHCKARGTIQQLGTRPVAVMAARTILSASKTQMARGPVSLKVVGLDNHRRKVAGRSKAARNNHRLARPSHGRNSRLARSDHATALPAWPSPFAIRKQLALCPPRRNTRANGQQLPSGLDLLKAALSLRAWHNSRHRHRWSGSWSRPVDQGTPGRRVCGYGKVWSDRLYRCVPFRTGGGTDGGNHGNRGGTVAAPASAGPKAAIAAFPVAVAVAASIST